MAFTLDDIKLENFIKKVTHSSDTNQGNKLVVSNGVFVQCLILLKIEEALKIIARKS